MSLSQRIAQWSEQPALVELFELNLGPIEPQAEPRVYRFAPQANELGQPILWQGARYQPVPLQADGFKISGRGALPRPSLKVTNLGGAMSVLCLAYKDLVGAKVTRRRTFARFLPAENFAAGNPYADEAQQFPNEVFYVRRKVLETIEHVEFELAWVFDLEGVRLPRRAIIADVCGWGYQSAECEWWAGPGPYFDENDRPCSAAQDQCSFTLTGCSKRWEGRHGKGTYLTFGGFPAARLTRDV